jgi:hypothetical protein
LTVSPGSSIGFGGAANATVPAMDKTADMSA